MPLGLSYYEGVANGNGRPVEKAPDFDRVKPVDDLLQHLVFEIQTISDTCKPLEPKHMETVDLYTACSALKTIAGAREAHKKAQ